MEVISLCDRKFMSTRSSSSVSFRTVCSAKVMKWEVLLRHGAEKQTQQDINPFAPKETFRMSFSSVPTIQRLHHLIFFFGDEFHQLMMDGGPLACCASTSKSKLMIELNLRLKSKRCSNLFFATRANMKRVRSRPLLRREKIHFRCQPSPVSSVSPSLSLARSLRLASVTSKGNLLRYAVFVTTGRIRDRVSCVQALEHLF